MYALRNSSIVFLLPNFDSFPRLEAVHSTPLEMKVRSFGNHKVSNTLWMGLCGIAKVHKANTWR